jgi:hypothetical protein
MTTHVNDGGVWRQLANIYVNDGGVWRTIQQVYVNDGGVWRTVYTNVVVITLTPGTGTDGLVFDWVGFVDGTTGSASPAGPNNIQGNRTLASLADYNGVGGGGYVLSQFSVSGFSSDPGQNGFFTSVNCNSVTRTAAGATGGAGGTVLPYSYSSGTAVWTWNTGAFGLVNGVNKDLTINF